MFDLTVNAVAAVGAYQVWQHLVYGDVVGIPAADGVGNLPVGLVHKVGAALEGLDAHALACAPQSRLQPVLLAHFHPVVVDYIGHPHLCLLPVVVGSSALLLGRELFEQQFPPGLEAQPAEQGPASKGVGQPLLLLVSQGQPGRKLVAQQLYVRLCGQGLGHIDVKVEETHHQQRHPLLERTCRHVVVHISLGGQYAGEQVACQPIGGMMCGKGLLLE